MKYLRIGRCWTDMYFFLRVVTAHDLMRLIKNGTPECGGTSYVIRQQMPPTKVSSLLLYTFLLETTQLLHFDTYVAYLVYFEGPSCSKSPNICYYYKSTQLDMIYIYIYIYIYINLTYSRWTSLPSCLWSQRIFPSLPGSRLTFFCRDASSALLFRVTY